MRQIKVVESDNYGLGGGGRGGGVWSLTLRVFCDRFQGWDIFLLHICLSVCRSVGRSVGLSVCLSVSRWFFWLNVNTWTGWSRCLLPYHPFSYSNSTGVICWKKRKKKKRRKQQWVFFLRCSLFFLLLFIGLFACLVILIIIVVFVFLFSPIFFCFWLNRLGIICLQLN